MLAGFVELGTGLSLWTPLLPPPPFHVCVHQELSFFP